MKCLLCARHCTKGFLALSNLILTATLKTFIPFGPSFQGWPKGFGPEAPSPCRSLLSLLLSRLRFLPHCCSHLAHCLHRTENQGRENGRGWLDGRVDITLHREQSPQSGFGGPGITHQAPLLGTSSQVCV